ncbi:hypothetical protein AURDEDRAFT_123535 [Auricularia subglabra TFB-10046 SS5]|nr:hypothetical protein AURDEDRAFT_123535 [Auricularia subglabra TFB-10046 SS5]
MRTPENPRHIARNEGLEFTVLAETATKNRRLKTLEPIADAEVQTAFKKYYHALTTRPEFGRDFRPCLSFDIEVRSNWIREPFTIDNSLFLKRPSLVSLASSAAPVTALFPGPAFNPAQPPQLHAHAATPCQPAVPASVFMGIQLHNRFSLYPVPTPFLQYPPQHGYASGPMHGSPMGVFANDLSDPDLLLTSWGTAAMVAEVEAQAPEGAESATGDIVKVYRAIPAPTIRAYRPAPRPKSRLRPPAFDGAPKAVVSKLEGNGAVEWPHETSRLWREPWPSATLHTAGPTASRGSCTTFITLTLWHNEQTASLGLGLHPPTSRTWQNGHGARSIPTVDAERPRPSRIASSAVLRKRRSFGQHTAPRDLTRELALVTPVPCMASVPQTVETLPPAAVALSSAFLVKRERQLSFGGSLLAPTVLKHQSSHDSWLRWSSSPLDDFGYIAHSYEPGFSPRTNVAKSSPRLSFLQPTLSNAASSDPLRLHKSTFSTPIHSQSPSTIPEPKLAPRQRAMTNPMLFRRISLFATPSIPPLPVEDLPQLRPPTPKPPPPPAPQGKTPEVYVQRLLGFAGKAEVAIVLAASGDEFLVRTLHVYMGRFAFIGDPLDGALRELLLCMALPRVIGAFAARYSRCNPDLFASSDATRLSATLDALDVAHAAHAARDAEERAARAASGAVRQAEEERNELRDAVGEKLYASIPPSHPAPRPSSSRPTLVNSPQKRKALAPDRVRSAPPISPARSIRELVPPPGPRPTFFSPRRPSRPRSSPSPLSTPYSPRAVTPSPVQSPTPQFQRPRTPSPRPQPPPAVEMLDAHLHALQDGMAESHRERDRLAALPAQPAPADPAHFARVGLLEAECVRLRRRVRVRELEAGAAAGAQRADGVRPGEILTLRVTKAGVLWRIASKAQLPVPEIEIIRLDAILSVDNSVALCEAIYDKYLHAFRFSMSEGRRLLLRATKEAEPIASLTLINYAIAFKMAGVRACRTKDLGALSQSSLLDARCGLAAGNGTNTTDKSAALRFDSIVSSGIAGLEMQPSGESGRHFSEASTLSSSSRVMMLILSISIISFVEASG